MPIFAIKCQSIPKGVHSWVPGLLSLIPTNSIIIITNWTSKVKEFTRQRPWKAVAFFLFPIDNILDGNLILPCLKANYEGIQKLCWICRVYWSNLQTKLWNGKGKNTFYILGKPQGSLFFSEYFYLRWFHLLNGNQEELHILSPWQTWMWMALLSKTYSEKEGFMNAYTSKRSQWPWKSTNKKLGSLIKSQRIYQPNKFRKW